MPSVRNEYEKLLEQLRSHLPPCLGPGCHWLRFYSMMNGRDRVGSEALLDNRDWPEGQRIVHGWDWPEGTIAIRHFLMLVPPMNMLVSPMNHVLTIFRQSPELDNEAVFEELLRRGVHRRVAARLLLLVPSAYCRVWLRDSGAQFPDTFCVRTSEKSFEARTLSSEPVWREALAHAEAEMKNGVSPEDFKLVAARGPELDLVNQVLQSRQKLQGGRLMPLHCSWLEDPPDSWLTLIRDSGDVDALKTYGVLIDGKEVGVIRQGETFRFPLPVGRHGLQLKRGNWCGSQLVSFFVGDDETVTFRVNSNLRGSKFGWLYIALFARNEYLRLGQEP
jgi:hypothetical protein